MDSTLLAVVGVIIVAIVIVFLLNKRLGWISLDVFRGKVSASTRGDGATIKNAKSRKGSMTAIDETGSNAHIEDAEAEGDIRAEVKAGASPKQ